MSDEFELTDLEAYPYVMLFFSKSVIEATKALAFS
jgi:hypothetical protein